MRLNIRNVFLMIFICLAATALLSCEWGLEVVNVEMGKLPDRIIYIANVDTELDFGNSTFISTVKQGDIHERLIKENKSLTINHNVDFKKPGVYEVKILYANTIIYDYLVQVIDDDTYQEIKDMPRPEAPPESTAGGLPLPTYGIFSRP